MALTPATSVSMFKQRVSLGLCGCPGCSRPPKRRPRRVGGSFAKCSYHLRASAAWAKRGPKTGTAARKVKSRATAPGIKVPVEVTNGELLQQPDDRPAWAKNLVVPSESPLTRQQHLEESLAVARAAKEYEQMEDLTARVERQEMRKEEQRRARSLRRSMGG